MGDGVMNQSISSSVPFLFPHKRLSYCVIIIIIIIILTISIFILIIIAINAIVIVLVEFVESLDLRVGKK